ncbi:MAG TPA: transglycosylase SLT domain-containing protein [Rhodoblastus sp.]|nr:transglycosylase SLT domain-containing protein [Rhodoblastus sp.]
MIDIAKMLNCDPNFLMAAMAFETGGSFSPAIQNPRSHATGLIQFMPTTAEHLGTSIDHLKLMTAVGQLDFVQQYLKPFAGRMSALSDVYMTILFPVAVGKPDSFVLFNQGTVAYDQNSGLDTNHDGQITKAEATSLVQKKLEEGMSVRFRG